MQQNETIFVHGASGGVSLVTVVHIFHSTFFKWPLGAVWMSHAHEVLFETSVKKQDEPANHGFFKPYRVLQGVRLSFYKPNYYYTWSYMVGIRERDRDLGNDGNKRSINLESIK